MGSINIIATLWIAVVMRITLYPLVMFIESQSATTYKEDKRGVGIKRIHHGRRN